MTVPRTLPPGRRARLRPLRWLPLLLLLSLPAPGLVTPVAAQAPAAQGIFGGGVELALVAGRTFYQRDEFCGLWDLYATSLGLIASAGGVGASVAFIGDYPWPIPPPIDGIYLDRGPSIQAAVELYPLHYLGEETRRLGEVIRPFVGAGLQASWDGDTYAPGTERPGPVYAVLGSVDPALVYGATLRLGLGDGRVGVVARFQGTRVFSTEGEFLSPTGETLSTAATDLDWSELRVGLSFRR
jgi:hypothetical protein